MSDNKPAYVRASSEISTTGADIILHMPRAFMWSLLAAFLFQVIAAIWFASAMTVQINQTTEDIVEHRRIDQHVGADRRLTRLEVLVEETVRVQRNNNQVLREIRDVLGAQDN